MTVLTESLEQILSWLERNNSSFASALQPGLTYSEIQDRVEYLPFDLPEEVYELYQWRNGTRNGKERSSSFFPAFTFNSLEQSLDHYDELMRFANELGEGNWLDPSTIWHPNWFPIFSFEGQGHYYFVICSEKTKKTSPILNFSIEDSESYTDYTSLTNMMLTIVECYETGVYYVSDYGDLAMDEERKEVMRQKYNPEAEFSGY